MAPRRRISCFLTALSLVALSNAGPLGPLPNVTSSDGGLNEGNCVVGDVAYLLGDKFVGTSPCEQCACTAAGVQCAQMRCEPRPGCKALHRPDHCCPTYQCECEQEGRVYGNGEKLVDPSDPCRVCYCQGGEVVCRRIACFLRDDCQPRLVPGRCCPEYDNCPLRGVTAIPSLVTSVSSIPQAEDNTSTALPTPPKQNIKQEITIKEITPVSEIPVITDVKIKEILPSPSIEVPEYPSSKSPLIPREAVLDKSVTNSAEKSPKTEEPVEIDLISPLPTKQGSKPSEPIQQNKSTADSLPSKISLSTQDSINSEIYPSFIPTIVATMGLPPLTPDSTPAASITKVTVIEEDDTSLFDHNPAFPPIPDDLSVIGNHEEEISPDQNVDSEHMTSVHEVENVASSPSHTETPVPKETPTTTVRNIIYTTTTSKGNTVDESISITTSKIRDPVEISTAANVIPTTSKKETSKDSPMLNLRSAIPTEILNVPSSVPEDITGELDDPAESVTAFEEPLYIITSTTTEPALKIERDTTIAPQMTLIDKNIPKSSEVNSVLLDTTTLREAEATELLTTKILQETSTASVSKSHISTEITSQTEFSSLPIETSDQNPHDASENTPREKGSTTNAPVITEISTTKLTTEPEVITATQAAPTTSENRFFDNTEPAVFVSHPSESSESTTDPVELLSSTSSPTKKNAALIDSSSEKKNNVLTDLINLVGDVASISDHTDAPELVLRTTTSSSFSVDSEELMPVYKSKNKNFNSNSITEIPLKSKNSAPSKQKVVEIEGEDFESITDSAPPFDKAEPTTRRPIIDHVSSDTMPANQTEKKDIEIINKSYVPTINRNRPTKVVMKKSNEKPLSEASSEEPLAASSAEAGAGADATTTPAAAPGALTAAPAQ